MTQPTNVTIFTDMSHKDGYTGFAYYIRSSYYRLKGSGCFEMHGNSNKNEMYAIGKALKALQAYHFKNVPITKVYIYCDNQTVVNQLQSYSKTKTIEAKDKEYEAKLLTFLNGFDYSYDIRKVKAHTSGRCVRTKTNNWMDEMARAAREKYVKEKFGNVKR